MIRHRRLMWPADIAAYAMVGVLLASPLYAYAETFWVDWTEPSTLEDGQPLTDFGGAALYRKLTGEKQWTFVQILPASSPTGGATRSDSFDLPLKPQDTWTIYVRLCPMREGGVMTPWESCPEAKKLRRKIP
jgi:hypothetical protein